MRGRRGLIPSESHSSIISAGATPSGPETLGSLVSWQRRPAATWPSAYGTPFISGKDSLYNEYTHEGQTPWRSSPTLLISAIGQVLRHPPVRDDGFQGTGQPLFCSSGITRFRARGSIWADTFQQGAAGRVPRVEPALGRRVFAALHAAIRRGLVRSCHDLSEGGLAVALAEMAMAGGLGANVTLSAVPRDDEAASDLVLLFSESPTRFLLEVSPERLHELSGVFSDLPLGQFGVVTPSASEPDSGAASAQLIVRGLDETVVLNATVAGLKDAWQRPLRWS